MGVKPKDIQLHIEELVLHGFAPADARRIGQAIRNQLGQRLTERGVPETLLQRGPIGTLDAGAFEMSPSTNADTIGSRVAQSLYQGLKQ